MASATSTAACALLTLPEELLVEIINRHFASTYAKIIRIKCKNDSVFSSKPILNKDYLSILRACRALHRIGAEVFYSSVSFKLARFSAKRISFWFQTIGIINLGFVTSIKITIGLEPSHFKERDYPVFEEDHKLLRTICVAATNLRKLSMVNRIPHKRVESLIEWIVMVKYVASLQNLSRLMVRDFTIYCMPYVWVRYMSCKLGILVEHQINSTRVLDLKHTLLDLATQIHDTIREPGLFLTIEHMSFVDTSFLDDDDIIREGSVRQFDPPLNDGSMYDPNTQSVASCSQTEHFNAAEEAFSQVSSIRAMTKLAQSGEVQDTLDVRKHELTILRAKFKFLRDFWMELKAMGLVVAE
jgi:hypothetical protein